MRALALAVQPALIGILIKGTLVLLVAAAASLLLRRGSASGRYLIWSSALVVLIALPILLVALPSWNLPFDTSFLNLDITAPKPASPPVVGQESPVVEEESPVVGQGSVDGFDAETSGSPEPTGTIPEEDALDASDEVASPPPLSRAMSRISRANTAALVIWIVGSFFVLGRLLFGFVGIWWFARQARPVMDRELLDLARKLSDDIGLKTPVRLLQSDRSVTPMTWGITWPAILLPKDASEWSDERRRMILLHELAHVKRRDCLVQFVVWLACSLYWMNPLVWIAVRKMHIERERACDDLVLDSGFQGSDYAEHLLEIAKSLRTAPLSALTTVAMAHRSHFETRLLAILDPRLRRGGWSRVASTAFVMVAVLGTTALATMQTSGSEPLEPASEERLVAGVDPPPAPSPEPRPSPEPAFEPAPRPNPVPPQLTQALENAKTQLLPRIEVSVRPLLEQTLPDAESAVLSSELRLRQSQAASQLTEEERESLRTSLAVTLQDENPGVRQAAALALAQLGDERATDALIDALSDEDPDVRRDAAYALGEIEDLRALEPVLALLSDSASDVRRAAAWVLGELEDPRAVEPLITALGDDNSEVRRAAIEALAEIEDPRALDSLIDAIGDPTAEVRRHAAWALGEFDDPRAFDPLIEALDDANAEVRRFAAAALGEIDDPRAVEPLIAALSDENPEVRRWVAAALGELDEPRAVDALIVALNDTYAEVRRFAAAALGELDDPRALDALIVALEDENAEVRRFAAGALGELSDEQAVDALISILDDENAEVRRFAVYALAEIGDLRALSPLQDALTDTDAEVRRAAAYAIQEILENYQTN